MGAGQIGGRAASRTRRAARARRGRVRHPDQDHNHEGDRAGAKARGEMTQDGKKDGQAKAEKASQVGTKVTGAEARGQVARDGQDQAARQAQIGQAVKDGQVKAMAPRISLVGRTLRLDPTLA